MRRTIVILFALAVTATAAFFALAGEPRSVEDARATTSSPATDGDLDADGGGRSEAQEQAATTLEREAALAEAAARGRFGSDARARGRAAVGWTGERVMKSDADDWEPAVAADPKAPFVYLLSTRYGAGKACAGNCPNPWIALEVSKDGGTTWSTGRPLCACTGPAQYDPIIEVVRATGEVYATYMNGSTVVFIKSSDHGKTWTAPVSTAGDVSWNDKPVLATSGDGEDVYVSWNGPSVGDPWIAQSHDAGVTWTQTKVHDSDRYFYAYDAVVMRDGTVVFSEGSMTYTGGESIGGPVRQHAIISRNGGTMWRVTRVASVRPSQPCADCRADFYAGHSSVTVDGTGRLIFTYDGAIKDYGRQRVWVKTSTDAGRTWSDKLQLSDRAQHSSSPMVEAIGDGDVRLVWMQTTDGGAADRWQAMYVRSRDGGFTWSTPIVISDKVSGAAYKHPDGFEEIYGDYGEIAITSTRDTFAAWGEGFSYAGPGGAWFNLGR